MMLWGKWQPKRGREPLPGPILGVRRRGEGDSDAPRASPWVVCRTKTQIGYEGDRFRVHFGAWGPREGGPLYLRDRWDGALAIPASLVSSSSCVADQALELVELGNYVAVLQDGVEFSLWLGHTCRLVGLAVVKDDSSSFCFRFGLIHPPSSSSSSSSLFIYIQRHPLSQAACV